MIMTGKWWRESWCWTSCKQRDAAGLRMGWIAPLSADHFFPMALIASSTEWTSGTTFLPSTLMTSCDTGGASSQQPPDPHENQCLECRCCEANLAASLVSSFGARKATCRTARPSVSLIFSSDAECKNGNRTGTVKLYPRWGNSLTASASWVS